MKGMYAGFYVAARVVNAASSAVRGPRPRWVGMNRPDLGAATTWPSMRVGSGWPRPCTESTHIAAPSAGVAQFEQFVQVRTSWPPGLQVGAELPLRPSALQVTVVSGGQDLAASLLAACDVGQGVGHGLSRIPVWGEFDVSTPASATQPRVWTFLDFVAPDERADELAIVLAPALLPDDGWYANFEVGDEDGMGVANRVFRFVKGDHAA